MKPTVYLETTIPSYLTARPSRDIVVAAHQELTVEWWQQHRSKFDLFISEMVLYEAAQGDPSAASRRLGALTGITILDIDDPMRELARRFVGQGLIPARAVEDAIHVAVATVQGIAILLTWNCRHIANAAIVKGLQSICEGLGYRLPTL